jgi:hypothetical protein
VYDLAFQIERERLASTITAEIEADSVAEYDEDFRSHLGASTIGDVCERRIWSNFRWLKKEHFGGRMHRLFKRGHFEEPKFIHRLRRIGFEIFEFDGDGKQYKISGHKGHYGGSLDSVTIAPARFQLTDPLLVEYKTHGEKSFAKLAGPILKKTPDIVRDKAKAEGLRKSKPVHYSQMCSYGQAYGLKYGLYCAINKNTDELYFEIVELDWTHGTNLYAKAERIIFSQTPPPKVAETAAYFECKMCHLSALCHYGSPPDINCRSCEHASPVEDAQWHCRVHEAVIPKDVLLKGCPQYRRII